MLRVNPYLKKYESSQSCRAFSEYLVHGKWLRGEYSWLTNHAARKTRLFATPLGTWGAATIDEMAMEQGAICQNYCNVTPTNAREGKWLGGPLHWQWEQECICHAVHICSPYGRAKTPCSKSAHNCSKHSMNSINIWQRALKQNPLPQTRELRSPDGAITW